MSRHLRLVVKEADAADVYRDIGRIPEVHRKDRRGHPVPEGSVCKLGAAGKSVYVAIRGMGDSQEPAIWIDAKIRDNLAVKAGQEYEFDLRRVWWPGQFRWAWSASDPAYRIAARMGFLSLVLGVIGLVLGLISFFHSG